MDNVRKIILTRGIQGSGKSTWARQWAEEDPEHRVRFNNDDIRNMLGKFWVPSREKLVKCLYDRFLFDSMAHKYDIIIDNMNLNPKTVSEIKSEVDLFNISKSKTSFSLFVFLNLSNIPMIFPPK